MDKMRFLKVLSIKMWVFMDKIEFFLYIAEPSGVLGAAGGARWEGVEKAGSRRQRTGTPAKTSEAQAVDSRREAERGQRRWTAGGRQREATAVDSRKEAERGQRRRSAGRRAGRRGVIRGKTVNFVLSFANNKGFD